MKLKVISTGSKGNCYILEGENSALVIDCGVPFRDIKRAVDFNTNKIAGVLISHSHNDHCRSAREIERAGLDIYTGPECAQQIGLGRNVKKFIIPDNYRADTKRFWHNREYWIVTSFYLVHDVECLGFLIWHEECGNVLYITDTRYVPHVFKDLHNIIIEANYSEKIIDERADRSKFVRDRVIQSHMSIETCVEALKKNDLSSVNNIVLIHLSDNNSDENLFREMAETSTGRQVVVAKKNQEIAFNKTPF